MTTRRDFLRALALGTGAILVPRLAALALPAPERDEVWVFDTSGQRHVLPSVERDGWLVVEQLRIEGHFRGNPMFHTSRPGKTLITRCHILYETIGPTRITPRV